MVGVRRYRQATSKRDGSVWLYDGRCGKCVGRVERMWMQLQLDPSDRNARSKWMALVPEMDVGCKIQRRRAGEQVAARNGMD